MNLRQSKYLKPDKFENFMEDYEHLVEVEERKLASAEIAEDIVKVLRIKHRIQRLHEKATETKKTIMPIM